MERGQIVELTIEDMGSEGQGIGKTADGFVVFVSGAVVGDRVRATLNKVKKNYATARLEEILKRSEYRNEDFYCQICGGCPFGLLQYEKQLEIKEAQVRSKLERLAGVIFDEEHGAVFNPIIGMRSDDNDGDGPLRYRNKAVMAISHDKQATRIGFNPARSHDVIDCEDCLLQPLTVAAAAAATKEFMRETKGWFKGMTVKTAFGTGQVMVVYDMVDKSAIDGLMSVAERLVDLLDDAIYNLGSYDDGEPAYTLESIALRYEKSSGSKGKPGKTAVTILAGSNTIVDEIIIPDGPEPDSTGSNGGRTLQFEISPDSFYQVNTTQMQSLYGVVREYCRKTIDRQLLPGKKPLILDLYCGVGTIGLCMADLAEQVVGIEVVRDAVIDANRNAVINGIVNAVYLCGKAEEEIATIQDKLAEVEMADETAAVTTIDGGNTIAILDPPRAGCRPELLEAIAKAGVGSIIYVSCDPATLARDLKLLLENGYRLEEATPVDMFPQTVHVECVVLMSKVKG